MSNGFFASEPKTAASEKSGQRMCSTRGCKTYIGKGRYADSFADVIVQNDGICLCAQCYLRGLYAAGKGSMSEITGRQPFLTLELVKEHWARLDADVAEKEVKRRTA